MKFSISFVSKKRSKYLRAGIVAAMMIVLPVTLLRGSASAQTRFTVLHEFTAGANDAFSPAGSMVFDTDGNLYGAARSNVFLFELIHNSDGSWSESIPGINNVVANGTRTGLIADQAGNLYGTSGGADGCPAGGRCGIVFKLTKSGAYWTESVIYAFQDGTDGSLPWSALVFDGAGNLYGTTAAGGNLTACRLGADSPGCGVVFKLTPNLDGSWTESVLHSFTGGSDGGEPYGGVVVDANGNVYGTAFEGGDISSDMCTDGCGVVFKISPNSDGSWTYAVLHDFVSGADGGGPQSSMILDGAGNLYSTTTWGGVPNSVNGGGTVFKMTPNSDGTWTESIILVFSGALTGADPYGGVIFDGAGNLYGTTYEGGNSNCACGVVFRLTPNVSGTGWTETVLHSFAGPDGEYPFGGLTLDSHGNLYGTTLEGGDNNSFCGSLGCGVVFKLSRGAADLQLLASASPNPVPSHHLYAYTFKITNNGPDPSEWPRLVTQVPYGTTFHSYAMSAPGHCVTPAVGARGEVTCHYQGTQPVGSTWTVTLNVWAWAPSGTVITQTAAVMAGTHDPKSSNNTVTITTNVQ
jgi:uncharacterized repeat protein (TIGR03803 family)